MFVRPFRYLRAESISDASSMLSECDEARLLAGGQSLMPMINLGLAQVDAVIDISRVSELEGAARDDHSLRLGALTRHRTLELDPTIREAQPLLAEAARHIGNPRVRNVGTLGGSLAHNDPAAELPLVMQVLAAELTLSDGRESRTVSADQFFVSYFTTDLREGELLVSVRVPALAEGWGWGFHEFSLRTGDFAIVAAAALARCAGGVIESARVGLAAVAEKAIRCRGFEEAVRGRRPDQLAEVVDAIDQDVSPPEDPFVSPEYRHRLARHLTVRTVQDACRRSQGEAL